MVLERKGETIPTNLNSVDGTLEIGLSNTMAPVFSLSWVM